MFADQPAGQRVVVFLQVGPGAPPGRAPARLGPITLRNRVIKAATFEGATPEALVTDELIEYHRRPAVGGVGMTTVAYCAVAPEGRTERRQIWMRPEAIPGLRRLTEAIHAEGAAVSAQIGHSGPVADATSNRLPALSPGRQFNPLGMRRNRAATGEDIARVTRAHAQAARIAIESGFDAVEIHLGHNYLASTGHTEWMAHRQRTSRIEEAVESGTAELIHDPDRPRAWTLLLNGTPQSHVDLDDPGYLDFEYVRRLGHVADLVAPPGRPLKVLHLGGGALTLPRYIAATRPRSAQQVIEVDAALVDLVRRRLPLERGGRIRIRTGDARAVLTRAPENAFDLVVGDVYADGRSPAHLNTGEFFAAVARILRSHGFYAANVADGAPLSFVRAQVSTLRAVLPEACLIAASAVLRGRRFGNVVVVAGRAPPPVAGLRRKAAGDPFPGRVLSGEELVRFASGAAPVTDATARPSPPPPRGIF